MAYIERDCWEHVGVASVTVGRILLHLADLFTSCGGRAICSVHRLVSFVIETLFSEQNPHHIPVQTAVAATQVLTPEL